MIDAKNFFDQLMKNDFKKFERFSLVKEKITQVVVCYIIIILKVIIR